MNQAQFKRKIKKASTESLSKSIVKFNVDNPKTKTSTAMIRMLVEQFLKREDKNDFQGYILQELIKIPPSNDEILHFYIRYFLGFYIPRKRFCRDHVSPFRFVSDMFFEKTRNAIAFANRTGGKTRNVSILNHLDMVFKPGCEVASAGAILEQAHRVREYFGEYHHNNEYLNDLLYKEPTQNISMYKNGSVTKVIAGTEKALNGPHPHKARIDEVELMKWEVLQQGLSMSQSGKSSTSGKEIMSQMLFTCITGDTLIDVPRNLKDNPDGIPVIDLLNRYESGNDVYVYSYSEESKQLTLSKVNKIWKTKKAKIWELEYGWEENGEFRKKTLKATNDHLIMLKNGDYKQIDELKIGDSLIAFNRKLKGNYHYIKKGNAWVPEYHYVYGKIVGEWSTKNWHIHHRDFNSYNNEFENLKGMSAENHAKLHANTPKKKETFYKLGKKLGQWNKDFWLNAKEEDKNTKREKISRDIKRLWETEYDRMCKASKKGHTEEARIKRSNSMKGKLAGSKNPMFGISYEDHPKGMLGKTHSDKFKREQAERTREMNIRKSKVKLKSLLSDWDLEILYLGDQNSILKISNITGYTDTMIKKGLKELGIIIRSKSEQSTVQWKSVDKASLGRKRSILAYYQHGNIDKAIEKQIEYGIDIGNHRVLSIRETDKYENVYDIEVENTHNFVIGGGIVLHNSTRKFDTGTMQRLLDLAKKTKDRRGGYIVYKWCIWEALEECKYQCKNDRQYGDCPIYDLCKGKAHKCRGFYKIDDLIDKASVMDSDVFDAEWLNKKPSQQIVVYGNHWNRKKNFITMKDKRYELYRNNFEGVDVVYMGGVDFGGSPGHDFVYKVYAIDIAKFKKAVEESDVDEIIREKMVYYVIYEYRSSGNTIEFHADKIKGSPHWSPALPIWADPSAKQERTDLEDIYGIETFEADNAVTAGIEKVRYHLKDQFGNNNYFIFEGYLDCSNSDLIGTDLEIEKYSYNRTRDGKPNREEPLKVNDHGLDVDRYVISSSIPYLREVFQPQYEEIEGDGYW